MSYGTTPGITWGPDGQLASRTVRRDPAHLPGLRETHIDLTVALGSVVGPFTLWAGYAAVSVPVSAPALLIGAMVATWAPVHIWAIATLYRHDYASAGVPMAPVVWGKKGLPLRSTVSALSMGAMGIAALAALLPWRVNLASRLVRLATAYLVVVLLPTISLAA